MKMLHLDVCSGCCRSEVHHMEAEGPAVLAFRRAHIKQGVALDVAGDDQGQVVRRGQRVGLPPFSAWFFFRFPMDFD